MQPYTQAFAKDNLTSQVEEIKVGNARYRAVTDNGAGFVLELLSGKETKYPILHVLGGKNICYFLTMLDRGRLQVLPVAYDLHRKQWFDTAASAVRHFPDRRDQAVHWTDQAYTFNTSCYSCHVSQLVKNYDPETDAYHTEWKEPGINCETCHGPAAEHVRVCLEAEAKGQEPKEMKLKTITQSRGYTAHQVDTACSICHAKMMPLTAEFVPGEDFFQHYDLTTLENPDFYPDGRDLGENYTYTSWRMSSCVKAGKLDCMYCHTSSGRYRFKGDNANEACTSCHTEKKGEMEAHSRHTKGVTQCIQCHMPKTEFGRMTRSDHSMRPPMPSATIRFQSPNACNSCHKDKSAKWADSQVRRWHKDDYQKPVLEIADLIDQARKGDWTNLPEMLTYLQRHDKDEIFANSLVRLLQQCPDKRVQAALTKRLQEDTSPLIRGSAADSLQSFLDETSMPQLLEAADDPYRIVRIRAAASLTAVPAEHIPADCRATFADAVDEYKSVLTARPDDAVSHYNLGNFYQSRNLFNEAIESYQTCQRLRQDFVPAYVNASIAYNVLGKNAYAVKCLKTALMYEPNSVAAHLNLALLYGEMGRHGQAEQAFRKTYELDSQSSIAAYNLSVLIAEKDPEAALRWCQKACQIEPANAKYAYTQAFYLYRLNRLGEAVNVLQPLVNAQTQDYQVYSLLIEVYVRFHQPEKAIDVCQTALETLALDAQARILFQNRIQQLTIKR